MKNKIQKWLDYLWLNKYRWYRDLRGGIWYLHEFSKSAEDLRFTVSERWWARYPKINKYSNVILIESL
jgi:hypothetical protein